MTRLIYRTLIIILVLLFLMSPCIALTSVSKLSFYLNYHYSAELAYQTIEIQDTKLFNTYLLPEIAKKREENPIEQRAYWTQADLKTRVAVLSKAEINDLKKLIVQTGFMKLKGTYGGAKKEQRYYPYTLEIKTGNLERKVVYQSFPGASSMPEAFKKIQEKLLGLVKKKFKV
jgi:hypothetical protein